MSIIIGIAPDVDGVFSKAKNTYVKAVEDAGATAVILPYTTSEKSLSEYAGLFDGFIFAGGVDVDPQRYGEEIHPTCEQTNRERDLIEFMLFDKVINTGKPILGICRGMQLLNVAHGGTLYQDINSERQTDVIHRAKAGESMARHTVKVAQDTPFGKILGNEPFTVNSFHHQAVKQLGNGLVAVAHADDGIVEAFCSSRHRFLCAVQWHPELDVNECEVSRRIFKGFAEACKNCKKQ